MKKIFSTFLAIIFLLSSVFMGNVFGDSDQEISILFTHDMHSHLDVDTLLVDGKIKESGGFAKIKTVKDQIESKHKGTFLLDGGDFAMGTPFQTIYREKATELRAMAYVGFDATTFGNHEFDYRAKGLNSMLDQAIKMNEESNTQNNKNTKKNKKNSKNKNTNIKEEIKLPIIVSSNIDWDSTLKDDAKKEEGKKLKETMENYGVKDYFIIEKNGVKMAVFGLLGEEAVSDAPLAGLEFYNYIERAKEVVKDIKEKGEADIIVCLSHSGTNPKEFDKSEDVKLAKEVPDIDVIISGHSHTEYQEAQLVGDTIIASCGEYNHNIGHIVLKKSDDKYKLSSYKLIKLDENVENNQEVQNMIDGYKKEVGEIFFKPFGLTYDQKIATSDFAFKPISQLGKEQGEEPLGNLVADAFLAEANKNVKDGEKPFDIAITPSGTIRGSFGKGDITATDIYNVSSLGIGEDDKIGYPLVDVYLTGKELRAMADVDATVSDTKTDARIYTSGLSYTINRKRLFLNRATDFHFVDKDGNKIDDLEDDKLYHVAGGLYTCQMLSLVKDNSFGLLSVEPKTKDGEKIEDFTKHIMKDKDGNEVKEWRALLNYISGFNGKVPEYYNETHGRKIVDDSFNPIKLLKQPNHIAIMLLCIILIPIVIITGIVIWIIRRRRAKRGFAMNMFSVNKSRINNRSKYSYRKKKGFFNRRNKW